MGRRGYNGYRGRTAVRDVFRLILVLLIVLLVLAAAGLMIAQRYIVYTDDGVRLELPFFRREEPPAAGASVSVDIVQRADPSEEGRFDENSDYLSIEW